MAKPIELTEPMEPEDFAEFVALVARHENDPLPPEVLAFIPQALSSIDAFLARERP